MAQRRAVQDPDTILYTVQEVADILKVDPRTVYRYINQGQLDAVRLSARKTRVRRKDLLTFIDRAREQAV
ncbi:MAG: helix-turn-helix domain-containing protein [Chloroflexota bacterium]|nr:helix-turn-helix domain-containing protein [Chloroflexota bacterium]